MTNQKKRYRITKKKGSIFILKNQQKKYRFTYRLNRKTIQKYFFTYEEAQKAQLAFQLIFSFIEVYTFLE